jgi:hypothetical protein
MLELKTPGPLTTGYITAGLYIAAADIAITSAGTSA